MLLRSANGSGLERLPSRDNVLCASVNEDGTDDCDCVLSCDDVCECSWVDVEATVGVEGSGVDDFDFDAVAFKESPLRGSDRSACFGGIGVSLALAA